MNNQMAHKTLEELLIGGDLSKLSEAQRNEYYLKVCHEVGLNPLTRPFDYIELGPPGNKKLVLYLNKGGADQLRRVLGISIYKIESKTENETFIVTAYARDASGREDTSTGAVSLKPEKKDWKTGIISYEYLQGENLANALLKAETKAKRRVTISMGGLGMLDESEIDSIRTVSPNDVRVPDFAKQELPAKVVTDNELEDMIFEKISSVKSEQDLLNYNIWKIDNKEVLGNFISKNKELAVVFKDKLDSQLKNIKINGCEIPASQKALAEPLTFN